MREKKDGCSVGRSARGGRGGRFDLYRSGVGGRDRGRVQDSL